MKIFFLTLVGLFVMILGLSPWINPILVDHDLLIIPKNILVQKNPLVRSINGMKVYFIKGEVALLRNEKVTFLKKLDQVVANDVVYVKESGWLILEFGFGSKVKINANSIIKVNELRKNLDEFDRLKVNTFTLEAGSLFVDYPNISHNVTLKIKNRRASMGIRGTEFIAALDSETQGLKVAVNHGLVELTEDNGHSSVLVGDMMGASVDAKGNLEEPKAHKWVKKIHWDVEETALTEPEDYETNLKVKAVEVKRDHKTKLEDIKTFKPSGNVVTNDNLGDQMAEAQKEAEKIVNQEATPVPHVTDAGQEKDQEQITEEELEELDLNFTRYNKSIPKISKGIIEKFAAQGLVPDKVQVTMETLKQVERYNSERLKVLDEVDEDVQD
ncbi:MAG: FecR domain-containing protein [Bacteriovoracaceae bacterium]